MIKLIFVALVAQLGFIKAHPTNYIVGGTNTTIDKYPYHASVRTVNNFHFCGGNIVSDRWVLSAAHCTIFREEVHVVVGTSFLSRDGIRLPSERVVNHPLYSRTFVVNDICLIKTRDRIPINGITISIIRMAPQNHFTDGGVEVTFAGWGFTYWTWERPVTAPDQLQRLTKRTLTNEECKRRMRGNENYVTESTICTFTVHGEGTCSGDSGGGLVENGMVIALSSWNIMCALGYPDGWELVSYHRPWIREVSGL